MSNGRERTVDSKRLCLRILYAESEREVADIISTHPDLSNPMNWFAIDGRDSNNNTIGNLAITGSKALTELCTNMIDAILMKHAHIRGIDPRGSDAPQSVTAGVRDLVALPGVRSGVLAEVDDMRYLRTFAEQNLIVAVTGGTQRHSSCFTFIDNGEGQRADDFESTFLSLSKGNKSDIPFVQGKFNMGSSGVLTYSGDNWYKLIISRRYDKSAPWGWTIVRRRSGSHNAVAEYFKIDGAVSTFNADALYSMILGTGKYDEEVSRSSGTIIKLYNYQMEVNPNFRNIRESLNQNLISTILPFRLMDYRVTPNPARGERRAKGIDPRTLAGMEFSLLRRDDENQDDEPFAPGEKEHLGTITHPELGHIVIHVIVLPDNLPGWLKASRNNSRVFHAVNGQVQHKENRAYISLTCGFPVLKDKIVVLVDSNSLLESAHNTIWESDRETVKRNRLGELYINRITEVIKSSPYLKELQQWISQRELEGLAEVGQSHLFQNLLNVDPNIAQLLVPGTVIALPTRARSIREPSPYNGKYSATFLSLIGKENRENGAPIAITGKRRLSFDTDAVNEYFLRNENRGCLFVTEGVDSKLARDETLRNGRLTINFEAISGALNVEEESVFSVGMFDAAMAKPVTEKIKLVVVAERIPKRSGSPTIGAGQELNGKGKVQTAAHALPPNKWLTKDGRPIREEVTELWPDSLGDFGDQDGGLVEDLGDGQMIYKINYGNVHFRYFLNLQKEDIKKKAVTKQYRIGMLMLMKGLDYTFSKMKQSQTKNDMEGIIDEIRRLAASGAAMVVMSIAKTLPEVVNPRSVADVDDL